MSETTPKEGDQEAEMREPTSTDAIVGLKVP